MKKILIFSSGIAARALIAEALLKTQIKQEKSMLFCSCGIEYSEQEIDNTKLMLCANKVNIQNINLRKYEELFEQEFDLIFILFNYLTEKATMPLCKGSMFYVGYQGKMGELDTLYKDIEHKIIGRIKSIIIKEFNLLEENL